jgi:RNA polymerase sigma-70 factor (ECF subfamily)
MTDPRTHAVTALLVNWTAGDEAALEQLTPIVHAELKRLAKRQMAGERPGHVLQATALVNEAYLRLVNLEDIRWQDRAHFFAIAARVMRRILVDFARARDYQKRGGGAKHVTLGQAADVPAGQPTDLMAIDRALEALALIDPRKSQVVELRFFGGLTLDETAEVLHISRDTVKRDWRFARLWLTRELQSA